MKSMLIIAISFCLFLSACRSAPLPTFPPPVTPIEAALPTPTPQTPHPTAAPRPTKTPIFRNIEWGMTREEIIAIEGREPDMDREEGIAFHNEEFLDRYASVLYFFNDDGRCHRAAYLMPALPDDAMTHFINYSLYRNMLIEQYGEPIIDENAPSDPALEATSPYLYERAYHVDDTTMFVRYEAPFGFIELGMYIEDASLITLIDYIVLSLDEEA